MRKRRSLRADQFKALSRSSSNDSVEKKISHEKVNISLSIIQIIFNLYEEITGETKVESLIRNTVRVINSFCKQPNGSEIILSQLQKIDYNAQQAIKSKRTNSMGARAHLTHSAPILNTKMDGLFLYPLLLPIKNSNGKFDVSFSFFHNLSCSLFFFERVFVPVFSLHRS